MENANIVRLLIDNLVRERRMDFRDELLRAAEEYGLELNEQQIDRFVIYYELLIEWNKKMNLTAITAPDEAAVKHMIDSLTCYDEKYFTQGCKVIDVGTGAGFPGLPLKIFEPSIKLTLLDSLNKRIKFLETVTAELGLSEVTCIHARAEEGARQKNLRENFDVAVSRAVAQLPVLLEYTLPFVKKGGYFIALKGMRYQEEADWSKKALEVLGGGNMEIVPKKLPGLDDKRACIYVEKVALTPKPYPRKAGTPEKTPIL